MLYVLSIITIVGIVALFVNRKAVSKLWFNLRSFVGAGAASVDARNAVNNMHQAVEDAKADISRYTMRLNESQGLITSFTRNSEQANKEVATLTARIKARAAEVGNNSSDPVLLDLATQLSQTQKRAAETAKHLEEQTELHNTVLVQVRDAVLRADELDREARSMGVNLDLSASRAELASVGLNFERSNVHGSLSAAERYKQEIQKQIDTNNGAVKVAQQLNPGKSTATAAWEKEQDAKAVLAGMGIE